MRTDVWRVRQLMDPRLQTLDTQYFMFAGGAFGSEESERVADT